MYNMSNYDDPERRYSCFSEPTQVLRRHPHSLSSTVDMYVYNISNSSIFHILLFHNSEFA